MVTQREAYHLRHTEVCHPPSSSDGRQHCLLVSLPSVYSESPYRRFPVLFVCDGHWEFPLLCGLYGGLHWQKLIRQFIIVGLAYGSGGPDDPGISARLQDYTPAADETLCGPARNGAGWFLEYLADTIIPFVGREYRVDGETRALLGCSIGGTFALYAMLKRPGLFSTVLAVSPNIAVGNGVVPRLEQEFHRRAARGWFAPRAQPPARVFIAVGEMDAPEVKGPAMRFSRRFNRCRYRRPESVFWSVPGEGHASLKGAAYSRALSFAFPHHPLAHTTP